MYSSHNLLNINVFFYFTAASLVKAVDLLSGPMPAVLWRQSAWLYAEFTLLVRQWLVSR